MPPTRNGIDGAGLRSPEIADSAAADSRGGLANSSRPTTNDATNTISCLLGEKSMRPSKILPLIVPIEVEQVDGDPSKCHGQCYCYERATSRA